MELAFLFSAAGGVVWTLLSFIVALSIIVAIHEYGHYIVGRWSGIDADVFSIGFGPILWSRMDRRGTRWQIAALPFGGYVKFAGDADAASSKDVDAMSEVAKDPAKLRRTMHGAPLWARASTVSAGPIFNFILSILLFAALGMSVGAIKDPLTISELRPMPTQVDGLQSGDVVLGVGGITLPSRDSADYQPAVTEIPQLPVLDYDIERDGRQMTVQGPYLSPPLVGWVQPQSAALTAGFEEGDVITAVNDDPVFAFGQVKEAVESSDGATLALTVWRRGETLDLSLTPRRVDEPQPDGNFKTYWRIGIGSASVFEPARENLGVGKALLGGAERTWNTIELTISAVRNIVTGAIGTCNLTGPIRIAKTAGDMAGQGFQEFLLLIAGLSTAIGFFNLFPIPVLDGGHLVFHAFEAVTGRPPSDKAMHVLMVTGLALVLALMVFVLGNDVFCP